MWLLAEIWIYIAVFGKLYQALLKYQYATKIYNSLVIWKKYKFSLPSKITKKLKSIKQKLSTKILLERSKYRFRENILVLLLE